MANKAISELPQALNVNNQDLFVLEQSGIAKKLPAETFITEQGIINALAEALDGHGGIQSVTLSSVSGRIRTYRITFTDQSATTFQVYDGTSIDRISRTSSSGLDDVYTIFLSDGTTTFFTVHNGADGDVSEAMLNDALKNKAPAITETTESSAIANFTDGADDLVMHNIVAEINPVQSGSGDPSPSNIRPISGWTGCNVTRTGKNLLDGSIKTQNASYVYFNTTGNTSEKTMTLPAGTYTVSVSYTGTVKAHINVYRMSPYERIAVAYSATKLTFTLDKTEDILLWMQNANFSISDIASIQLELGSTATTYEPYIAPTTVSLSWQTEAGTVYGGTIDVATGLLTVTHVLLTLNTADMDNNESYPGWAHSGVRALMGADINMTYLNQILNVGTTFGVNTTSTRDVLILPKTGAQSYGKTQTEWIALAQDVQIAVPLATPQTYQLTPQEVLHTLYGVNNVWADTGNVSVTYPADTKMFIEKLTMPTEDDLVANQAITSGKYFMIGNSLYLALANIASGAQITIGTNAQRVSLADALNTINS